MEGRSCNHCCYEKAIRVTCCECVFVALGNHIDPHYFINGAIFEEKNFQHKMCFDFPYFWPKVSHSKINSVRYYDTCTQVFMQSTHYSSPI